MTDIEYADPFARECKPSDVVIIHTDHGIRVGRITAYGTDGTYVVQVNIPADEITIKDGPAYRADDPVRVAIIASGGRLIEGRILGETDYQFCTTCHCKPINPDHTGDGSACCPGPWYLVTYTWVDGGEPYEATETFAEHEIYPAAQAVSAA